MVKTSAGLVLQRSKLSAGAREFVPAAAAEPAAAAAAAIPAAPVVPAVAAAAAAAPAAPVVVVAMPGHRLGDAEYVALGWTGDALKNHLLSIGWVTAGQTRRITAGMHENHGDIRGAHYTVDNSYHVYPAAQVVTDDSLAEVHRW